MEIAVIAITMAVLDAIYLFFAKKFYENQVIQIQRVSLQVKPLGVIWAYFTMALAMWYFVLKNPTTNVYGDALVLAFAVFGTYNATSYALLKKYRLSLGVLDTVWGMLMFAFTAVLFMRWKFA